jgi:hypothetical protein
MYYGSTSPRSVVCLTLKKQSLKSFETQATVNQMTQWNTSENRNKYLILNVWSQQVSPNASQRECFSASLHGLARIAHQRHATVATGARKPHVRTYVLFLNTRLRRRKHYSASRVVRGNYPRARKLQWNRQSPTDFIVTLAMKSAREPCADA